MGKKEEPIINQPTQEEQRQYKSLENNTPTEVAIPRTKKKYLIRWLKHCQLEYLTRLLIHKQKTDDKDRNENEVSMLDVISSDAKLSCKAAAIYTLNGLFKLHFCYWFRWRWFYYIRQYDDIQLQPILAEGKKKVPLMQFFAATTSLIGAKDTLLQMTMMEAEHILQGLSMEQLSQAQSTESSSSEPDTSSLD